MARFRVPRPRSSWQGPAGALFVTAGVGGLAGVWWALVAVGAFFLVATLSDARLPGADREDGDEL